MAVDAHLRSSEEAEEMPIPSFVEAEEQFRTLKQRLSVGWDKVSLSSLYQLQDVVCRSVACEKLNHAQRLRLGTLYDAANTAISEILGTPSNDDSIWKFLGISSSARILDSEFEALCVQANTVISDLRACGRILLKRTLRGIGIGR